MRRTFWSSQARFFLGSVALVLGGCASSGGPTAWSAPQVVTTEGEGEPVGLTSGVSVPAVSALTDGFTDGDASAVSDFHPVLAPYGTWHDDARYGLIWVPDRAIVGDAFAPYLTSGRWGLNESQAHVWLSDHDDTFGWVVFHYGRWLWTGEHGWAWVPGRTYAPAWVEWRAGVPGDPYIGWGPMAPTFIWRRGRPVRFEAAGAPLVFCPASALFREHIEMHVLSAEQGAQVSPSLVDFDARASDGRARPRLFAPSVQAVAARGPSVESGHIPPAAWPSQRYSRAGTPNARYASPGGMGRYSAPASLVASRQSPGARLKTYVTGGAQVRANSTTPPRSATLRIPVIGGSGHASEPRLGPTEDLAAGPASP